jgi:Protein of unknown function (DUF2891)
MPRIPTSAADKWLQPVVSQILAPRSYRIWAGSISVGHGFWRTSQLPASDKRLAAIRGTANAHSKAGLAALTGEHYEGGHWLGSFGVYLVTKRGISNRKIRPRNRFRSAIFQSFERHFGLVSNGTSTSSGAEGLKTRYPALPCKASSSRFRHSLRMRRACRCRRPAPAIPSPSADAPATLLLCFRNEGSQ